MGRLFGTDGVRGSANKDLTPELVNRLRSKYSDDNVVDSIMEYFSDRRKKISKIANVFMDAFQRKYRNDFQTMTLSRFMKKALKYKASYNLSNDEFDEIKRVFEQRLYNSPNAVAQSVIIPNTNVGRVLGHPITESTDGIKPSNTDDYSYLQEILKLFQTFRSLHSYVVLQAMSYQFPLTGSIPLEVQHGTFDNKRHNKYVHVHPVIAALFIPKIKSLEDRMLYANIAGIVNTRYNRQRILMKPDYELFYSMVVDPADTICDNVSPLRDLKSRAEVQIQLWNNVFNLRSGKPYEASSIEFMQYIDKCKVTNMDHPDLVYLSDEGVILRRLFSIFAFRPIIIQTAPIMNVVSTNPLAIPPNVVSMTAAPYIIYRLPMFSYGSALPGAPTGTTLPNQPADLDNALDQIQFFMENGVFVPKMTKLFTCNNVLIFYVPRKYNSLPLSMNVGLGPINPSLYNNSMFNHQKYIATSVRVENQLNGKGIESNQNYRLRSYVYYNVNADGVIIGHNAWILSNNDNQEYQPLGALPEPRNNKFMVTQDANEEINRQTKGTIFVYEKVNDDVPAPTSAPLSPSARVLNEEEALEAATAAELKANLLLAAASAAEAGANDQLRRIEESRPDDTVLAEKARTILRPLTEAKEKARLAQVAADRARTEAEAKLQAKIRREATREAAGKPSLGSPPSS